MFIVYLMRKSPLSHINICNCPTVQVYVIYILFVIVLPDTEPWWRHQMEAFSALLVLVRGIHRSPLNSTHKGKRRGALMFPLICAWINAWVNNREAGDLRLHRAHYYVTVMRLQNNWCVEISILHCVAVGNIYRWGHINWNMSYHCHPRFIVCCVCDLSVVLFAI